MRLQEIIGSVEKYFLLAVLAVLGLAIIFFLIYFVYKKVFGGKKRLSKRRLLLVGLFICYVIMVIGVTFLNRGSNFQGKMELSLFSSYREAWYNFNVRNWQFVLLNIFMFVPFGFLFPLLHSRFQKPVWTIGMAALFTLFIECAQLVTGYGIFELDDLFNNLVGSIIGYGIIMGLLTMKAKKIKHSFLYFSPLLLTGIVFGSMFFYYHVKEFGNLSIRPIHKTDMTEAAKTVEIKLNDKRVSVPVYKAPSFTKKEADEFVVDFFKRINVDPSNMEDISYPDLGVYRVYGENSYNLSFEFLDGSYDFLDFSSHNGDIEPKDVDKEAVQQQLTVFGVEIPEDSSFKKLDTGVFEWTVDKKEIQNQLIDGSLVAKYYSDDTVKGIDNQLVTYEKVRDVQIKSEHKAYEDIVNGKFNYYYDNKKIGNITIHKVEVSYYLDSKGYYQPVYAFYSTVDGTEMTILIPGI